MAIIQRGKIAYEGEISALKRTAAGSYTLQTTDDESALAICRAQPGVDDVRLVSSRITFTASEHTVAALSQALVEAGALIRALTPHTATLEDLFFTLTEGEARQEPVEERVEEVVG